MANRKQADRQDGQKRRRSPQREERGRDVEQAVEGPDLVALQRAVVNPGRAHPRDILGLQHAAGNVAVSRLVSAGVPIQAKLRVGPADDRYEREADRIADRVVTASASTPSVQRQEGLEEELLQTKPLAASISSVVQRQELEEEELLQMKSASPSMIQPQQLEEEELLQMRRVSRFSRREGFDAEEDFGQRVATLRGRGRPLPEKTRAEMEARFGASFAAVRVHADDQADRLNQAVSARAFTHGTDLYFAQGRFDPSSTGGKRLLAHELTHVIQQNGPRGARAGSGGDVQRKAEHEKTWDELSEEQQKSLTEQGVTNTEWNGMSLHLREFRLVSSMKKSTKSETKPSTKKEPPKEEVSSKELEPKKEEPSKDVPKKESEKSEKKVETSEVDWKALGWTNEDDWKDAGAPDQRMDEWLGEMGLTANQWSQRRLVKGGKESQAREEKRTKKRYEEDIAGQYMDRKKFRGMSPEQQQRTLTMLKGSDPSIGLPKLEKGTEMKGSGPELWGENLLRSQGVDPEVYKSLGKEQQSKLVSDLSSGSEKGRERAEQTLASVKKEQQGQAPGAWATLKSGWGLGMRRAKWGLTSALLPPGVNVGQARGAALTDRRNRLGMVGSQRPTSRALTPRREKLSPEPKKEPEKSSMDKLQELMVLSMSRQLGLGSGGSKGTSSTSSETGVNVSALQEQIKQLQQKVQDLESRLPK